MELVPSFILTHTSQTRLTSTAFTLIIKCSLYFDTSKTICRILRSHTGWRLLSSVAFTDTTPDLMILLIISAPRFLWIRTITVICIVHIVIAVLLHLIQLPVLRQRKVDYLLLAEHFRLHLSMRPVVVRLRNLVSVFAVRWVRLSWIRVRLIITISTPLLRTISLRSWWRRGHIFYLRLHEWIKFPRHILNGLVLVLLEIVLSWITSGSFVLFRPLPPRFSLLSFHALNWVRIDALLIRHPLSIGIFACLLPFNCWSGGAHFTVHFILVRVLISLIMLVGVRWLAVKTLSLSPNLLHLPFTE
jgi:hypothetical protein